MSEGHALLSPSGSSRRLKCTPSAVEESKYPDSSSRAADEGTLAHTLSEYKLKQFLKPIPVKIFKSKIAELEKDPLFSGEMHGYTDAYVQAVIANIKKNSHVFIERKVDTSEYVPKGSGTADTIIITDDLLDFWDLKYGKGVAVFASGNTQLMIYALGALRMFRGLFDIKRIRLNIYQPRLNSHSVWEISTEDLLIWAKTYLAPRAQMAINGEGEYKAGDHCRFCKAKHICRALADYNLELFKHELRTPNQLTDAEILEAHKKFDTLSIWVNAVNDHLYTTALAGKKWPGLKMVEGKSNRVYKDPGKIEKVLISKGYKNIFTEPVLLGVTALTKAIGPKPFSEIVEPLIYKPPGKPTLVDASDKRPEYSTAEADFKQLVNDKKNSIL